MIILQTWNSFLKFRKTTSPIIPKYSVVHWHKITDKKHSRCKALDGSLEAILPFRKLTQLKRKEKKPNLKLSDLDGLPACRAAPASPITACGGLLMIIYLQTKTPLTCYPRNTHETRQGCWEGGSRRLSKEMSGVGERDSLQWWVGASVHHSKGLHCNHSGERCCRSACRGCQGEALPAQ